MEKLSWPPSKVPEVIKKILVEWREAPKEFEDKELYEWKLFEAEKPPEGIEALPDAEMVKSPFMTWAEAKAQEAEYKRMEKSIGWLTHFGHWTKKEEA